MGNKNSGRRPQPTALKVLLGNPGQRPLNDAEPKPPARAVERPAYLSQAAGVVWNEIAPVAIEMGTLTVADCAAFATLCELEATRRKVSEAKDGAGWSVCHVEQEDDKPTELVIDGLLRAERDTAGALRPYYEKFGLEPVGRARIRVPKSATPENKWEAMGCA